MYYAHTLAPQYIRIALYAALVYILYSIGFVDYTQPEDFVLLGVMIIPSLLLVICSMRKHCKLCTLFRPPTWLVTADLFIVTMLSIFGEEQLSLVTLSYFFIIFAYGLHTGYQKTVVVYLLSLVCLVVILFNNPYFTAKPYTAMIMFGMLLTLPLFLISALKESDDRHRAQATFLARMSHELRNPLNGVIGAAELLSDTSLSSRQYKYIHQISALSHNLLDQIKNILDFQKIEDIGLKANYEDTDIHHLIHVTVESYRSQAEEKDLSYQYYIDTSLARYVQTDPALFTSILSNLITNSINYTSHGSIRIELDQNRNNIALRVIDTGQGIAEEMREVIMNPFVQGNTEVSKYQGTGLGTSIVKNSVEAFGGQMSFDSVVDQGTTFTILLPFHEGVAPKQKPAITHDVKPLTVLLAEDDIVNLKIIRGQIEALGHSVITSVDGEECLKQLKLHADSIDVILLDLSMPKLTGEEVLQTIPVTIDHPPKTYVLTANATPEIRKRCLELGAADFLAKPIDRETLAQHLGFVRSSVEQKKLNKNMSSLLNMQEFDMNYQSKPEFALELVEDFKDSVALRIQELQDALDNNNHEQFIMAAHSIKGISATIGATKLFDYIKQIHEAGKKTNELKGFSKTLPQLKEHYQNAYRALRHHVSTYTV